MENFRRYCKSYLRHLDHPFTANDTLEMDPESFEETVEFACRVLAIPSKEHRLADLDIRFGSAFDQYLVVSRDQAGALSNAVERLAGLLEPHLKKLTYLCYPRRTVRAGRKAIPLWHCGMERIIRDLGLSSANLRRTENSYWEKQPLGDANWRIALVSRHKGSHEAHQYNLVELERIAKSVIVCYLLAARKALDDPRSKARSLQASSRVRQLNELLSIRAQTYRVTRDLPEPLEHLRFYESREGLILDNEKVRVLFESYLAGNGPVFYFLEAIPLQVQVQWAQEIFWRNKDAKLDALGFLFEAGQPPKLKEVLDDLAPYTYRYRLAFFVEELAEREDAPSLWKLHRNRAAVVRRAGARALVRKITTRHHQLLQKAAMSNSARTKDLFVELALGLAHADRLGQYRSNLKGRNKAKLRYSLLGLGRTGLDSDIPLLEEVAARSRLDRWTREIALFSLVLLASRVGDLTRIRKILRNRRTYVVKAGLRGMGHDGARGLIDQVVKLYPRFPREAGDALWRCATKADRGSLRKLLARIKLDDSSKKVVLALATVGGVADIHFILRLIARSKRNIGFQEQYEAVFAIAKKAKGPRIRRLLRTFIEPTEFWGYYGEERTLHKMPVANHENIPLVRRLAGLCFGQTATRKDLRLLQRMLGHWYWAVSHGAANAFARLGGPKELDVLLKKAIQESESNGHASGFLEAIRATDKKLYGKLPKTLPNEASFGETRGF